MQKHAKCDPQASQRIPNGNNGQTNLRLQSM